MVFNDKRGLVAAVAAVLSLTASIAVADAVASAHWIWLPGEDGRAAHAESGDAAKRQFVFRKTFSVAGKPRRATLRAVADFCHVEVFVNGQRAGSLEAFGDELTSDVSQLLVPGENIAVLRARSVAGPSAVALELSCETDKEQPTIVTDGSWQCRSTAADSATTADANSASWLGARELGCLDAEHWLLWNRDFGISALDDYTQWKQALETKRGTDPASFFVTDGFEVQLVHSAREDEGSWVSLTFDPRGRAIVGREDRGLLRMTLAENREQVASVERLANDLQECRGLLFFQNDLFVNANNSKGLYRLRDTNGDDQFDETRLLYSSAGGVGHGRNCLALGPDNMIYSIHGDSVDLPRDFVDLTSPYREHRRGQNSKEGHVIRTDRDGKTWHLVTAGLRNPFGIAFNVHGDMFTYDADAEFDMGSPWYRPTRVNHLLPAGDYGWRGVTGQWPPYYPDHPDNAPPMLDIGKGSPTAVRFGYGSRFPPKYREALFVHDWAYGRIIAVHLEPRGASYVGRAETFVKGRPLNVTGLDVGPDGALYFVTGGRKTQSALYRVRYVGGQPLPAEPTVQLTARRSQAERARQLRHRLEACCWHPGKVSLDEIWPHLANPDPAVQYLARTALEHQPIDKWRDRAMAEKEISAALTAWLALTRSGQSAGLADVLKRIADLPWQRLTTMQKLQTLYVTERCLDIQSLDTQRPCDGELRDAFVVPWLSAFADDSPQVRSRLANLLVRQGGEDAIAAVLKRLETCDQQAQRMHYLFVLREHTGRFSPQQRETYFAAILATREFVGGQGMPGFLETIRSEALNALPENDRKAWQDWLDRQAEVPAALPASTRPLVQQWKLADLSNAIQRLSADADLKNGQRMFHEALCSRCHRVGRIGHSVGPDLTSVSSRFSRRDLLMHTLSPSQVVAENYRNVTIETDDGKLITGRVVASGDFRSPTLRIATDPLRPGETIEIAKRAIVAHRQSPESPMPRGLLDTFRPQEITDLLAFIEAGGGEP